MHRMEITEREFDSFYIPMRELLWRTLKWVGEKPIRLKIPAGILLFLDNIVLTITRWWNVGDLLVELLLNVDIC